MDRELAGGVHLRYFALEAFIHKIRTVASRRSHDSASYWLTTPALLRFTIESIYHVFCPLLQTLCFLHPLYCPGALLQSHSHHSPSPPLPYQASAFLQGLPSSPECKSRIRFAPLHSPEIWIRPSVPIYALETCESGDGPGRAL